MSNSGAVLAVLPDLGGADEVWFNEGDGHYFVPGCNQACRAWYGSRATRDQSTQVVSSWTKHVVIRRPIAAAARALAPDTLGRSRSAIRTKSTCQSRQLAADALDCQPDALSGCTKQSRFAN